MSSGVPELGSKISLISKADIRYEGRLFTVDPQECTIALASVRSFGTEDRETQFPVAPQNQVYDYILFRGADIKDIRVLNNVPSLPNDPAIMQMSVPANIGAGGPPGQLGQMGQFPGQFGQQQQQYPPYHPMAGFPGVHPPGKTSELLSPPVEQPPVQAPYRPQQVKDQASMLDLIGGVVGASGSRDNQNHSRSNTPALSQRKSPTNDQGTQAGAAGARTDARRGSNPNKGPQQPNNQRLRTNSRNRQRYPSQGQPGHQPQQPQHQQHQQQQHHPQQQHPQQHQQHQHQQHQHQQHQHQQQHGGPAHYNQGQGYNRGGWRGRSRGRGRGFVPRNKNTLKFDNDYDFELANTEFEELRTQLAKTKISDGDVKVEVTTELQGEVEKKEDSGNETGAGEPETEEESAHYDKAKSFFDNISCEAVERSKGRSQRTDWRTERKLNSETFGVASARRGAWRGRGGWRHGPQHNAWRSNPRGNIRGRPTLQQPRPNTQQLMPAAAAAAN